MMELEPAWRTPAEWASSVTVAYQPLVGIVDGSLLGVEALARWAGDDGEPIRPDEAFSQGADQSKVSQRVLELAIAERAGIPGDFVVSVNLPVGMMCDEMTCEQASFLLDLYNVPASQLMVELLENAPTDEYDISTAFARWQAMGVRTAIDDFGSGYSTAETVRETLPDVVKLDRDFIGRTGARGIVLAVKAVADAVHADLLVEGVETVEERAMLAEIGVLAGQGYLFSPAVPGLAALAASYQPRRMTAVRPASSRHQPHSPGL